MKCLILAENLEINRTSSGLRSHKQIILYKNIFSAISVITSTEMDLVHRIPEVEYHFMNAKPKTKLNILSIVPKSVAIQNIIFGLDSDQKNKITDWKEKIVCLLDKQSFDFVISLGSGASFLPAYAVYYLKFKYKFKHLMFVHDPFPLNQYPPPYQKKNSLPFKSVAKLFGKVLRDADILSFPSLRLMEWMNSFYPGINKKSVIQPHIGMTLKELEVFLPATKKGQIPEFPEGINIVHTGTLLGPRNPLFIINALQKLFDNYPESKKVMRLHIIGKVSKDWDVQKLKSEHVYIYPERYTYLQSLKIQQNADILLLIEAVSEISPFMPGKLADYLMAKKPILALTPKTSETSRILGKEYPLLVENGNINDIYNRLILLYNLHSNNSIRKLKPVDKIIEYISLKKCISDTKEYLNKDIF
jgi:hypothetical protein